MMVDFVKLSSAWRKMVRSGKASDSVIKQLQGMGLLHTPAAIARETRGINRGTRLLSRKKNIKHKAPATARDGSYSELHVSAPAEVENPKLLENAFPKKRDRLAQILRERQHAQSRPSRRKQFQATTAAAFKERPSLADLPKAVNHPKSKLPPILRAQGPVKINGGTVVHTPTKGDNRLNAVVRRHEVDENLIGARSASKNSQPTTAFSSHMSPEVIAREAGHSNFLYPRGEEPITATYRGAEVMAARQAKTAPRGPRATQATQNEQFNEQIFGSPDRKRLVSAAKKGGLPKLKSRYSRLHGDYYGMSKKKRRRFDMEAAAQFNRKAND